MNCRHKPALAYMDKRLSVRPEWRDNRLSLVASIKPNPPPPDAPPGSTMDPSPLTQQARPGVFEPKVVALYKALFRARDLLPYSPILQC